MEDPVKEQQPSLGNDGKSKLRYPLRSSTTKLKAEKSPTENSVPAHKRGRATSSVSKSVNVASLSSIEKSAKPPPRRLSIPAKRTVSPRPKPGSKNTPISDTRVRRSITSQGQSETPLSDVSKYSARRKFNALSSASYWLSQIKLSESVPNHAVSLGFFNLALEAGCEPLQRLRAELKSYVLKHNIVNLEEKVKALFELYGISETLEQLQASKSSSHVPEEGSLSSIEVVQGSSSPVGAGKLKLKSLNTEAPNVSSGKETFAKLNASKTTAASRLQGSVSRKSVTPKLTAEKNGTQNTKSKIGKVTNKFSSNGQGKIKQENKSADEAPSKPLETDQVVYENKENMDATAVDEIRVT